VLTYLPKPATILIRSMYCIKKISAKIEDKLADSRSQRTIHMPRETSCRCSFAREPWIRVKDTIWVTRAMMDQVVSLVGKVHWLAHWYVISAYISRCWHEWVEWCYERFARQRIEQNDSFWIGMGIFFCPCNASFQLTHLLSHRHFGCWPKTRMIKRNFVKKFPPLSQIAHTRLPHSKKPPMARLRRVRFFLFFCFCTIFVIFLHRMESLRLMPPVPMTLRRASKDQYIDGILVPKGTIYYIPVCLRNSYPCSKVALTLT